jgi:hypothetical protein
MVANPNTAEPDVILIGAGIMSATLGTVLKELEPSLNIVLFETLHDCALESSEGWNNSGTGHAANCELNYTPQRPDGSVDISEALEVNTEFDLSRQLWSFLVTKGAIPDPRAFINPCPHMSFVWGAGNVAFLRQRFKEMSAHHCYHGMEYSEYRSKIASWAPLIMDGRDNKEPFAATRMITGSDVDYGALTHLLVKHLSDQPAFTFTTIARLLASTASKTGAGVCPSRTLMAAGPRRPRRPSSSSSEQAEALCRCCRSPRSPKAKAMADSPSAASGCAATWTPSVTATMPRSMARPQ